LLSPPGRVQPAKKGLFSLTSFLPVSQVLHHEPTGRIVEAVLKYAAVSNDLQLYSRKEGIFTATETMMVSVCTLFVVSLLWVSRVDDILTVCTLARCLCVCPRSSFAHHAPDLTRNLLAFHRRSM
jgi:hypothetical protein